MMTQTASSLFTVSKNVSRMKPSSTLAAMQAAEALRATGANVVDFGAGEPDFDTPENIKRAAAEALRVVKSHLRCGLRRNDHCHRAQKPVQFRSHWLAPDVVPVGYTPSGEYAEIITHERTARLSRARAKSG